MKIKKNDNIKILTGKDKGKTGKVLQVLAANDKVVVEGLNLRYKHAKPKKSGEQGQRILFPAAINVSNISLVCSKCGKTTRVGYKVLKSKTETSREKKQRICKKCSAVL